MNIRKKLAVAAAVMLPVSGLAVVGGVQLVSAGGPPVLTCSSSLPTQPTTGGVTFDNGTGPGTAGLSLGAGLNQSAVTTLNADATANRWERRGHRSRGHRRSDADPRQQSDRHGGGRHVAHTGVAGSKNFETAIITPNTAAAIAKKTNLTINPSTTGTYQTINST